MPTLSIRNWTLDLRSDFVVAIPPVSERNAPALTVPQRVNDEPTPLSGGYFTFLLAWNHVVLGGDWSNCPMTSAPNAANVSGAAKSQNHT